MWKTLYENWFLKPITANSIPAHIERGELHVALEKANRLLEMDAEKGEFYRLRAEVKYHIKDYHGAIQDCETSSALDVSDENTCRCYTLRGMSRLALGETQLAIADFGRAISASTLRSLPAFIERGKLYMEEGNLSQALEDFSTALRFEVTSGIGTKMQLRMMRAEVYVKLGDDQRALMDYEKARFYKANNPLVNTNLATLYHQLGQTSKAVDVLQQAMRDDPKNADQYVAHLARIDPSKLTTPVHTSTTQRDVNRRRHPTERDPNASTAKQLRDGDERPTESTIEGNSSDMKPKKSTEPQLFDLPTFNADSALRRLRTQHSARAYNFAMQGDLNRALTEIDKALNQDSQNIQDHILRGNICLGLGRYEGALASFRTAQRNRYSTREEVSAGFAGEALTLLYLGEKDDARVMWERLVEHDPAFNNPNLAATRLNWAKPSIDMVCDMLDGDE